MTKEGKPFRLQHAISLLLAAATGVAFAAEPDQTAGGSPAVKAASAIDAGRYLAVVGGCNDCHTAGWAESNGSVPESEWLTGIPVGFRGPWGTTYPSNLRRLTHEIDEDAWVAMFRDRTGLPPMPWMNVNRMSEDDSRALYRFIRSLGNAGSKVPTAVAPGVEPATPYIDFAPQHMDRLQAPPASGP